VETTPLVSVIIPNFNYSKYIKQAVDSVLKQSYSNIEVIVVDDGSTDDSMEVLRSYGSRIKLIPSKNFGACTARNLGVLHSTGDLIAFLDADDYWEEDKIKIQVDFMQSEQLSIVACKMKILENDFVTVEEVAVKNVTHEWFINNPGSTLFAPSSAILTRELAARVGAWNTNLTSPAEDFDYFRRCSKHTEIIILESALVVHRQHQKSLTSSNDRRYFEDNVRAIKLMLLEDRIDTTLSKRLQIWTRVHWKFFKHVLKHRGDLKVAWVLKSYVTYF
jgi:glycosyltransferase involved in cell wall biosynthesis